MTVGSRISACVSQLVISLLLTLPSVILAKEPATPPAGSAFKFPHLEERVRDQVPLRSAEGFNYRILISKPSGHAPSGGYPVIYVLDGNAWSGVTAEIARLSELEVGPAIVVGIGYVTDSFLDPRRIYDFTPPVPMTSPLRGTQKYAYGGADVFLKFIEEKLKPLVQSRYSIDTNRQVLFGHSLGGLFVLHVLFTQPQLFNSYIAASPSIWFNDLAILKEEQRFSLTTPAASASRRLFVTIGELEQTVTAEDDQTQRRFYEHHANYLAGRTVEQAIAQNDDDKARSRMVDNAKELVARIHNISECEFFEFVGEDHMSVLPAALSRALPKALARAN